jgi:hypothetical protein
LHGNGTHHRRLTLGLFAIDRAGVRRPVPTEEQGALVPLVRTSQAALELHPECHPEPELDL